MIRLFAVLLCLISLATKAGEPVTASWLLKRITTQKDTRETGTLNALLPSYINDIPRYNEHKKDQTIFYNLITAQLLHQYRTSFAARDQQSIDSFLALTKNCLHHFQNNSGRHTWNFWRTDTSFRFPYSWWIPALRGNVTLPDDMDDTVLALALVDRADSVITQAHLLMQQYINRGHLHTTSSAYQDYPAYSAWFGKKFPVVFDISVLCNVLLFVHNNRLIMSDADNAGLQLIIKTIERNDHIRRPVFVSPYYPQTAIIIYHISKLLQTNSFSALEPFRQSLTVSALDLYQKTNDKLEQIILSNAIMKMGGLVGAMPVMHTDQIASIEKSNYAFFTGNIPSYFQHTLKSISNGFRIMQYRHYCPAWNDALLLENLLLQEKSRNKSNQAVTFASYE